MAYEVEEVGNEFEAVEPAAEQFAMSLEQLAQTGPNIAGQIPERAASKIVSDCVEGYERDKSSRSEWEADYDAAMKSIRSEKAVKNFPFDGCANVSYPLITVACMQFNANAYPAIVSGEKVVKGLVTGSDPEGKKQAKADRVSEHMSFQLLEEMPEWERETDGLLLHLPAAGMAFRQYTWSREYARPKSEFISAKRFVVNQACQDLQTIPLITKEFDRYPYQIKEAQRTGEYVDVDVTYEGDHDQSIQCMLECHMRYDLDDDGYPEPYVAVIHKQSQKLLSLKPDFWPQDISRDQKGKVTSIARRSWFVDYVFIPDPEGGFYGIGFGRLLRMHSEVIDTIINQLLDAATLQNAGGGFIGNGLRLDGGRNEFSLGEWKNVNVSGATARESIVPLPTPGPSSALFQLLGMIVDSGKEVAQIKDVLTGETSPTVQPTTLMALIEQGMKVFNAIYKRVYRGLKAEFGMVYTLNAAFLPDEAYYRLLDTPKAIARDDYDGDTDVRPVSDPAVVTGPQKLAKAQFLAGYQDDPAMDGLKIRRRIFEAAGVSDFAELFKDPNQPDPAVMMAQEAAAGELAKNKAENDNKDADTAKKLAEARKTEIEADKLAAELIAMGVASADAVAALEAAEPGGMGGLDGQPGDAALPEGAEAPGLGGPGGVDPGVLGSADGSLAGPDGAFLPEGQGPDGGGDFGPDLGGPDDAGAGIVEFGGPVAADPEDDEPLIMDAAMLADLPEEEE